MAGILIALILNGIISHGEPSPPRKPASPPIYSDDDPIQKCLNKVRRDRYEKKLKRLEEAEKEAREKGPGAAASPFKFDLVSEKSLPSQCREGNLKLFIQALNRQIENCKMPPRPDFAAPMRLGCKLIERDDYCLASNRRMLELAGKYRDDSDFPKLMEDAAREFDWYKSRGMLDNAVKDIPKGKFQFTGFYAPEPLVATKYPNGNFRFPIYRTPDDLVDFSDKHDGNCGVDSITGEKIEICRRVGKKLVPYYTRREIDVEKKLDPKYVIGYGNDIIDIAFFMIQGDGLIIRDGERVRLNFAHKNGQPSSLLGNIVNCTGGKSAGMESIRAYLRSHPDQLEDWMNYDRSYIFFSEGKGDPKGVENIEMTERHTLATDLNLIRTGSIILFQSPRPIAKSAPAKKVCGPQVTSMAVSQDTGGAIRNTHADWYMGEGKLPAEYADSLNSPGTLLVGVLKGAGTLVKDCKP